MHVILLHKYTVPFFLRCLAHVIMTTNIATPVAISNSTVTPPTDERMTHRPREERDVCVVFVNSRERSRNTMYYMKNGEESEVVEELIIGII